MSEAPRVLRWYRRIVRLYPPSLRSAHGDEMAEAVQRRWRQMRDRSAVRRLAFALETFRHAAVECAAAWVDVARRRSLGADGGRRRSRTPPSCRWHRAQGSKAARAAELLAGLFEDLRLAARALRRTPGFAAIATLTLALGIGANAAIFGIVETVLLAPLPYPDPDRLVAMDQQPWTPTEITLDLRHSASAFEEIAGYYPRRLIITGAEQPLELEGAAVTRDFFRVFGARMARGRGFTEADLGGDAARVAVIGHGMWQRLFGGAEDVLGRTIVIDGVPHEIVGVLEAGFRLHAARVDDPQLWIPLVPLPSLPDGSYNWEIPVGRLAPDATLELAQAELDVVMARFRERHEDTENVDRWDLRLATLKDTLVGDVRRALMVLQASVAMVLLLACVNVANLCLARSGARRQELAVREAIGASRGRLAWHLLSESLLLGLLGGAGGLIVAFAVRGLLLALAPSNIPRIGEVALDTPVFLFTLLVSVTAGLAFGAIPGLVAGRRNPYEALEGSGRGAAGSRRNHRFSQALAAVEVCLTLVLLVAAGLLGRSFLALTGRDPGFRRADVATVSLRLSSSRYGSLEPLEDFFRRARQRIAQIPGVEDVAVSNYLPISMGATREYLVEGRDPAAIAVAQYGVVSPEYFRLLEIPLLRGRVFDDTDRHGQPPVAVIDEEMRRVAWPGEDPIGKRLRMSEDDPWLTVVGLVGSIRGRGLAQDAQPGFYVSSQQRSSDPVELAVGRNAVILVRSGLSTAALADSLRRAVWEVDPLQPVPEVATLESAIAEGVSPQRFRALLLGGFAAIALLTAVAGIYGVVAYLVSDRTRELGIRMAMGATPGDIVSLVVGWGLRLTAAGVALGVTVVFSLARYLSDLLFAISPTDAATILASLTIITSVTVVACLLPAWRAMRVDAMVSLRAGGRKVEGR